MRKLPASACSVVYLKPIPCIVLFSPFLVRKCLKFVCLLIFLEFQGTLYAVAMPSSTTQPISMFREPVHFPLMTNGRCVVANEISSSEYEGSNGQKWHCSSSKQSLKQKTVRSSCHSLRTLLTQFTQHNSALYTDDLNDTQYNSTRINTFTYFHTSATLYITTQTQNNPNSETYRPTPLIITLTLHNTPDTFVPSPQKNALKQVAE